MYADYKGKRAALYARYSTDMQNDKSADDQLAECREFAARNGIRVVGQYTDKEKSSQTLHNRVGLWEMMDDAKKQKFDIVLIESPSRLSRNQYDGFRIKNSLEFRDIDILTIHQGVMDDTQMAIHGLVGGEFIKQLKYQIKRGMKGRAREGKVVASNAYGYKPVPGKPGDREIVPEKAEIIRRIFEEYSAGESPRAIAMRLKAEGVPAPGRAGWTHQNISGGRSSIGRGGILNNRIYLGEVRYGDTYKKLNHETGSWVNRKNTKDEAVVFQRPELRIVSDEQWAAAHAVMDSRVRKPAPGKRRPWARNNSLLAGMCKCPCGAFMICAQRSRGGSSRIKCSAAHFRNECEHTKSYDLPRLEKAVRDALCEQLGREQDLEARLAHFRDEYQTTFQRRQREARQSLGETQDRLRKIEASINNLISFVEEGTMAKEMVNSRIEALLVEKAALEERERSAQADIRLVDFPTAVAKYREAVRVLQEDLSDGALSVKAKMAFRNYVESVTVFQTAHRKPYEFRIEFYAGALMGLELYPPVTSVEQGIRERGGPVPIVSEAEDRQGRADLELRHGAGPWPRAGRRGPRVAAAADRRAHRRPGGGAARALGGGGCPARLRGGPAQGHRRDRDRDRPHRGQVEGEPEPTRGRPQRRRRGPAHPGGRCAARHGGAGGRVRGRPAAVRRHPIFPTPPEPATRGP